MPSARSATAAMRPTTPLSPRYETVSPRFEAYQQSRQPSNGPRSPNAQPQRRQYSNNLTLPGLPRFHPANYPSAHSSVVGTPLTGPNTPRGPMSPVLQQKFGAHDTQKQMHAYQREHGVRPSSSHFSEGPDSPRLQPLGSPGPVTPLLLETSAESYMSIPKVSSRATVSTHPDELVQKINSAIQQREKPVRAPSGPLRTRT